MNKKDIALLGDIVSEMLYANESENQTITFGAQILANFPAIKERLTSSREVVEVENLVACIRGAVLHMSTSFSGFSSDDNYMRSIAFEEDFYEVVEEYLDLTGSTYEQLSGVLEDIGTYKVSLFMKGILKDSVWIDCVNQIVHSEVVKNFLLGVYLTEAYKGNN